MQLRYSANIGQDMAEHKEHACVGINLSLDYRSTKYYKVTMSNYTAIKWATQKNGQILRKGQPLKTELVTNRKYNQTNNQC